MSRSIPILLYHHVAPDREIRPEDLEAQLHGLLDAGYRSLSLDELLRVLSGEVTSTKGFVVTFDDGYLDNWTYAFPVLKKLDVKATMYLVTDRVEETLSPRKPLSTDDTHRLERQPGGFLSWGEAEEMQATGLVSFGSHTQSHRNFVRANPYTDIAKELRTSKSIIESRLGQPCKHLAWPWGDHEESWKPLARAAGYASAATTRSGANVLGADPFSLQRLNVSKRDPQWLLGRLSIHSMPPVARVYGWFHGFDRRLKVQLKKESPYSA